MAKKMLSLQATFSLTLLVRLPGRVTVAEPLLGWLETRSAQLAPSSWVTDISTLLQLMGGNVVPATSHVSD